MAPRRLASSVCLKYPDIEQRIARVTDGTRTIDDIYSALTGPLATRETRMEVVTWIAVCQFNCRISGGFVRDWIVGGYSSKPSSDIDPSDWIRCNELVTYAHVYFIVPSSFYRARGRRETSEREETARDNTDASMAVERSADKGIDVKC